MGVFSLQRVQALRHANCEVLVVSPLLMNPPPGLILKPGQAYGWIKAQAQQPFKLLYQDIPAYYPKWFCPPKKIFGWAMSDFLYLQVRNTVKKRAKAFHPEVILSSWLPDGVAASRLGFDLGVPTLAIADGTDVNLWPEVYRGWNRARDVLNDQVSAVIFVSEALRAVGKAKGLYGRENVVLHNAVDIHLFQPAPDPRPSDNFTVLSVGRLVRGKGFHILLEAFADFSQRINQPAHLILVGDGPQRKALIQQAADLNIGPYVDIVNPVEQTVLVEYYQQADLFCLPSYSEGLPCVVVEAMACGKPVVASNVGGIAEVVDEKSGILVAPGDASALCEALLQAKNRAWNGEIIRKKIVDDFGWEKWSGAMLKLMDAASI